MQSLLILALLCFQLSVAQPTPPVPQLDQQWSGNCHAVIEGPLSMDLKGPCFNDFINNITRQDGTLFGQSMSMIKYWTMTRSGCDRLMPGTCGWFAQGHKHSVEFSTNPQFCSFTWQESESDPLYPWAIPGPPLGKFIGWENSLQHWQFTLSFGIKTQFDWWISQDGTAVSKYTIVSESFFGQTSISVEVSDYNKGVPDGVFTSGITSGCTNQSGKKRSASKLRDDSGKKRLLEELKEQSANK